MDGVKQWAFSVCTALTVCGIAQIVLPKGNLEKMFKLTVSVFFLCCLLSPVVLQRPELRLEWQQYSQDEIERRAERLLAVVDSQSEQAVENGLRELIGDKLDQMGIIYTRIAINFTTSGQHEPEVDTVEITMAEQHEAQHTGILAELRHTFSLRFRLEYVPVGNEEE